MPTQTQRFTTSHPIAVDIRNPRGAIEVLATDTGETSVDITSRFDDLDAEVRFDDGAAILSVEIPRRRFGKQPRVTVTVHVPSGSRLTADAASASINVRGPMAGLELSSASGSIQAEEAHGPVSSRTASGSVRLGEVHGTLEVRAVSGSIRIGEVDDVAAVRVVSGSIEVGTAGADLRATAVSGSIHVREVQRGTVDLTSTSGGVTVGVRRGTLVWLDLSSVSGRTHSALAADAPMAGGNEETLTLTARSVSGSINVSPSSVAAPVTH
ncbi:MAG: DUF4097 family beta strand repeat-containing protein [Acidimicrobiales bacterium]